MMLPTVISTTSSCASRWIASLAHFLTQAPHFLPPLVTQRQDFFVDQEGVGDRLREGDVDRLPHADPGVELARHEGRADLGAGVAGDAGDLVDPARVLPHRDLVVPGRTAHALDLGVGPQGDVLVLAHRNHLRRQDAGGAVEGREGLVEHGHLPADGAELLDEVDLLPGARDFQGGLDAADAAADDKRVGMDGLVLGRCRQPVRNPVDRAVQHGLGALGRTRRARTVSDERCENDFFRILAREGHRARERRLVVAGGIGGDDDPVEIFLPDLFAEGHRIKIRVVADDVDQDNAGELLGVFRNGLQVDAVGGADPCLADVHARSQFFDHSALPRALIRVDGHFPGFPSDAPMQECDPGGRFQKRKKLSTACIIETLAIVCQGKIWQTIRPELK